MHSPAWVALKYPSFGNSLAVLWLGLGTFTALAQGPIPGQGTNISHATCAVLCLVAQLCSTPCDRMDCSPPGSWGMAKNIKKKKKLKLTKKRSNLFRDCKVKILTQAHYPLSPIPKEKRKSELQMSFLFPFLWLSC